MIWPFRRKSATPEVPMVRILSEEQRTTEVPWVKILPDEPETPLVRIIGVVEDDTSEVGEKPPAPMVRVVPDDLGQYREILSGATEFFGRSLSLKDFTRQTLLPQCMEIPQGMYIERGECKKESYELYVEPACLVRIRNFIAEKENGVVMGKYGMVQEFSGQLFGRVVMKNGQVVGVNIEDVIFTPDSFSQGTVAHASMPILYCHPQTQRTRVGWFHTHPGMAPFLSDVDVMATGVGEVALVVAPRSIVNGHVGETTAAFFVRNARSNYRKLLGYKLNARSGDAQEKLWTDI